MASEDWRDTCTYEACGLEWSYFAYRPAKSVNLAFVVLFGLSTLAYLIQGLLRRRWPGFTIAMVSGNILEVVGYIGRVLAHDDLYHEVSYICRQTNKQANTDMKQTPFLIQIVCLTIAPAFLAAGIYLCLARIVTAFGAQNSRIKARSYPRIFIPCDVFSLVLQAAGGGYASIRTHQNLDPKIGNNIMIAGLAVQVATLLVFIVLAVDFAIRTLTRINRIGANNALDPRYAALRKSWMFKCFLIALSLSTLCIFTRCVFRVVELSEGWNGHLIKIQKYFIGFEGAVIVAAVYLLNVFHPGFCFQETLYMSTEREEQGVRNWYGGKRRTVIQENSIEMTP